MWDNVAPTAEQAREEEVLEDSNFALLDPDNLTPEQLNCDQDPVIQRHCQPHSSISIQLHLEPDNDYYSMVRNLNNRQRQIHDFIFLWCRQSRLSAIQCSTKPPPFHLFLSGGAGVGKTHPVHTIYQSAVRELRTPGNKIDNPTVLLTVSTGKAAVNIGGTTLHSAFHLPVRQTGQSFQYRTAAAQILNTMRATYGELQILVIDEISMVGAQTLSNLDRALQDIFENDSPFGDLSRLVVGDLLQLNPVGDVPVFKGLTKGYSALAPNLWDLFTLYELQEIVQQKENPTFAGILSRVRVGQHTPDDVASLQESSHNDTLPRYF